MNRVQRHLGRELALLWLFQIDVGKTPVDEALSTIPDELQGLEEEGIAFGCLLARGVREDRRRLDALINQYAHGWAVPRLGGIERNILRLAIHEILSLPDIPTSVSIDEAVELSKTYGAEESSKFVNGVLGAFVRGELQGPETA